MSFRDKINYFYIKNIKKHMVCPSCENTLRGYLYISEDGTVWKCDKCGYSLCNGEFSDNYTFWFCDCCGTYLNAQEDFDRHASHWSCKKCGFDNDITERNFVGICKDCGEKMPNPKMSICEKCKAKRLGVLKNGLQFASDIMHCAARLCSDSSADLYVENEFSELKSEEES